MAMNGHPGLLKLLDDMKALHLKKSADYGSDGDPLANYRACREVGVEPWRGVVIRLLDKVQRLKTFALKGKLENEGVEDTFKDIAAHSLIALILFREIAYGGDDHDHPEEAGR